jgi:5S rRNA maturation endonuclease (ribonuclease M5)
MHGKRPDFEDFLEISRELRGKLLIVEGIRDEKALKTLGLNNIIKINRKPLYRVAEEAARAKSKEIVILTDFDREGRALAAKLSLLLSPRKIRINRRLRRKIMEFGKPEIENLRNLKEDDLHVKVGTNFNKIRDKGKDKGKGCSGKT